MRPIIGITMGDPAGVGPEVVVKALSRSETYLGCRPLVIGDSGIMARAARMFAPIPLEINAVTAVEQARFQFGCLDVFAPPGLILPEIEPGKVSAAAGEAAARCVETAVKLALAGHIHAIATAPLNKDAMNQAGYHYPGHTEMLAELTGTKDYAMMLTGGKLRVLHVSTHVSLQQAIAAVTTERVLTVIRLADQAMRTLRIENPRIAVAGLNPHAGEGGLFGKEEILCITPAIKQAQEEGIQVAGPLPPDTVFLRASRGEFDAVVAMYHDQGHIPLKMLGFETGVNSTVGLPIIRTSVDHGTAFRRAWQGRANPQSMIEAIELARQMAEARFGTGSGRP